MCLLCLSNFRSHRSLKVYAKIFSLFLCVLYFGQSSLVSSSIFFFNFKCYLIPCSIFLISDAIVFNLEDFFWIFIPCNFAHIIFISFHIYEYNCMLYNSSFKIFANSVISAICVSILLIVFPAFSCLSAQLVIFTGFQTL